MKNKTILTLFSCLGIWIVLDAFTASTYKSAGAPLGHSGAPLESTCAKSSCHDDGVLNSGPGILSLDIPGTGNGYAPGQTYTVAVNFDQTGIDKFGFQSVVLKASDQSNAGEMGLVNGIRTQVIEDDSPLSDFYLRQYVTHTLEGNIAQQSGSTAWSFKWTAPSSGSGDVVFYFAGIASNNNLIETGDDVYADSLVLSEDLTAAAIGPTRPNWEVGPNPFQSHLQIASPGNRSAKFHLYNTNGQLLLQESVQANTTIDAKRLAAGVYLYQITRNHQILKSGKLVAQSP